MLGRRALISAAMFLLRASSATTNENLQQLAKGPKADSRVIVNRSETTLVDPKGQAETGAVTQLPTVMLPDTGEFNLLTRDPLDQLQLDNIKPLYTSPGIPGEGVWETSGSPKDSLGKPIVYKTFYRPSVDFPNAIVFMMVLDMSKAFMQVLCRET